MHPCAVAAAIGTSLLLRIVVTPRFMRHFGEDGLTIFAGRHAPMSSPTDRTSESHFFRRRRIQKQPFAALLFALGASAPAERGDFPAPIGARSSSFGSWVGATTALLGQFMAMTVSSGISFVIVTCGRSCHCS